VIGRLPSHVANPDPALYKSDNYVVLDFETTTQDFGSPLTEGNRIVLAAWRTPDGVVHTRRAGEFYLGDLVEDCRKADFIVAHNAKFELGWLRRCGLDLYDTVVYDTMFPDYVLGGNKYVIQHLSLSKCLARWGLDPKFDLIGKMIKVGIPVEEIPESWLLDYCIRDVEACHELFLKTRDELYKQDKMHVMYQRCLVTPCLTDIEFNGMQLDEKAARELVKEKTEEYQDAERELEAFCGGINAGSPKQLRAFIYGELGFGVPKDYAGREILTPTGEPSTATAVMDRLKGKTARQRQFLELRGRYARLRSDVTKYLTKFAECCDEDGGLLSGQFNQTATKTHRLSSSGRRHRIQFQNINRDFKRYFTAREEGWLVGEADGAQLEFRVATHLGRDRVALADIRDGTDIHSYTARVLTEAGQSTDRQGAKAHTFKPLYGGSSGTDAERTYYDAFKDKYSGVADAQQTWIQTVLRDKSLRTEWGLEYFWPDTRSTRSGYVTNTTSICNYPVQAFATAEIIPIALVCAWHRIGSAGLRMFLVNTIHDSIIAELPKDEEEAFNELAVQCLIDDVYDILPKLYGISLSVPLGAGVKCGTHWSVGEEQVYEAKPAQYEEAAKANTMLG
jgi:DNA polymerase I-like protein with 3'-5' exonuclease and polymerase domains